MVAIKTPLLVIVGPTAIGKTKYSIEIAKKINGEIICADSWTIRRGLNIGSAKPSIKEQSEVPHHLIDIINPCDNFSAAEFKELANNKIKQIQQKNKIPILVGGSGLYIYSIIYDYSFVKSNKENREKLNKLSTDQLVEELKQMNVSLDHEDIKNKRRLIRLVENKGIKPKKEKLKDNTLIIGLRADIKILEKNIKERTSIMINEDLEKEVSDLYKKYGWSCEGLKGVNYAQWHDYFNGLDSINEVSEKLIYANKHLAKKQITWFKKNPDIKWFDYPFNTFKMLKLIKAKWQI